MGICLETTHVQDHGRDDAPSDWREDRSRLSEHVREGLFRRYVALRGRHDDVLIGKLTHDLQSGGGDSSRPGWDEQVFRASPNHPSEDRSTDTTEAPCHEICTILVKPPSTLLYQLFLMSCQ